MQSFFDKRMGAGWKISFVVSVVFLVAGVVGTYSLDAEDVIVYTFPLATWITVR